MEQDQKTYWESKWKREDKIGKPNPFAKKIIPLIKKRDLKKILDLGCGDGRDTIYFAKNGFSVLAVDFSENAIEKLKKELIQRNIKNVKCKVMDISTDLKYMKSCGFDVIYAHLSLHYFDDETTTKIFNELHRILKKNGLIFIKVKSINDPLYGKGKLIEKDMFLYDHIRHFFSKEYMREKLRKFKILRMRKTSSVYHKHKSSFIEVIATK